MSDRSAWRIRHSNLNLHPYKLQIVHSWSDRDKEVRLQFYRHFQGILTENPDLPNNLLMSEEAHCHLPGKVKKHNFRYWSAANPHERHQVPFMTQKLLLGVLFCPEESVDPTSWRMKTDKPSQSHCNVTNR